MEDPVRDESQQPTEAELEQEIAEMLAKVAEQDTKIRQVEPEPEKEAPKEDVPDKIESTSTSFYKFM